MYKNELVSVFAQRNETKKKTLKIKWFDLRAKRVSFQREINSIRRAHQR